MNKKKIGMVLLMAVSLTGCISPSQPGVNRPAVQRERSPDQLKRDAYLQSHPALSSEVRAAIRHATYLVGMTAEQVRVSNGSPQNIRSSGSAEGMREQWCYALGSYLYFKDGILESWQENDEMIAGFHKLMRSVGTRDSK